MPRLPFKLRILLLSPLLSVALALAVFAILFLDHPFTILNTPHFKANYHGGILTLAHIQSATAIGPSSETIDHHDGFGPVYAHFIEMNQWKQTLPTDFWHHLGITYQSMLRVAYTAPRFTADRWTTLHFYSEYFLLFIAVCLAVAALAYRNARRIKCRLRVGFCPRCGYDLRASPIRCPECGMARITPQ